MYEIIAVMFADAIFIRLQNYFPKGKVETEVDQASGSTYLKRWISKPDPPSSTSIEAMYFAHFEW